MSIHTGSTALAMENQRLEQQVKEQRAFLTEIATTLYAWARESRSGGWSTHQVEPQTKLAGRIHEFLAK